MLCHPLFVAVLVSELLGMMVGCENVVKATLVGWKFGCGCWYGWEAEPGVRAARSVAVGEKASQGR